MTPLEFNATVVALSTVWYIWWVIHINKLWRKLK